MKPQELVKVKSKEEEKEIFIAKLKKSSGLTELSEITVTRNGEDYTCYLRPPNRGILEEAMGLIMKLRGNPEMIRAGEVIIQGCWVDGDEIIKTDEELFVPACIQAASMINTLDASLKKI